MPRLFTPCLGLLGCSLLIGLLAAAELARGDEPPAKATEHVRLIIDYGDGVQKHYTELPWRPEMTVLDALRLAQEHPRDPAGIPRQGGHGDGHPDRRPDQPGRQRPQLDLSGQ